MLETNSLEITDNINKIIFESYLHIFYLIGILFVNQTCKNNQYKIFYWLQAILMSTSPTKTLTT